MMGSPRLRYVDVARPLNRLFVDQRHSSDFHFRASLLEGLTYVHSLRQNVNVHRALAFPIRWDAPQLDWLLFEFRLLVNESIRIALREDIRSRTRLACAAYRVLSLGHVAHKKYISSAFEVALSVLKAHRRRLKRKRRSSIPYMRKLMLKAENQSYRLDRETGRLRIPARGTEGVQLHLPLSEWHRSFLSDPSWTLGSLTVVPGKIILVVRREAPKAYEPGGGGSPSTRTWILWTESWLPLRVRSRRAFRSVAFGESSKRISDDEGNSRRKRPGTGGSCIAC